MTPSLNSASDLLLQSPASPFRVLTILTLLASALSGCSTRAIYNSIQLDGRQQCEQQPIATQQACRAQYEISFDDYEREREELLNENNP